LITFLETTLNKSINIFFKNHSDLRDSMKRVIYSIVLGSQESFLVFRVLFWPPDIISNCRCCIDIGLWI